MAELRSFVRAAEGLAASTSGVAKAVRQLEDRLGVKLLHRTTRRVSLTDDGQAFYLRAKRLVTDYEEAESALSSAASQPQGLLRVDAPVGYGRLVVLPHVQSFMQQHPKLRIEFRLNDRYVDLVDEGIDVAVRAGVLADSGLIARSIGALDFATYAAPSYLARRGEPVEPDDLAQHELLAFAFPTGRLLSLRFERDGQAHLIEPEAARAVFNNGEAMTDAAVMGLGIAQLPRFHAAQALSCGALKPVLTDWQSAGNPLHLVYAQSRHLSAKVRAFVDHMVAALRPDDSP